MMMLLQVNTVPFCGVSRTTVVALEAAVEWSSNLMTGLSPCNAPPVVVLSRHGAPALLVEPRPPAILQVSIYQSAWPGLSPRKLSRGVDDVAVDVGVTYFRSPGSRKSDAMSCITAVQSVDDVVQQS